MLSSYNCAIYVRVSTGKTQQETSPENQILACRELARRKSSEYKEKWLIPDSMIYEDTGTGTSMVSRPAVQRLLRDASEGKFQIVLFKGISRFARDTEDALHMLRRLVAAKVRVVTQAESYDSKDGNEFVYTIHAGLAQQGSEKISIDVLLGNKSRAGSGKWNGKVPDGFVINQTTKSLIINPERSVVIKKIFDMYTADGVGITHIVEELNNLGIKTGNGGMYLRKSIYDILTNRVYVGDVIYGRRYKEIYYDQNNQRKKRTVINEDRSTWVVTKDAHPAIISREQFDKAQKIIESNKTHGRGRNGRIYLLSSIMKCSICGFHYCGKVNHIGTMYYRCNSKVYRGASGCTAKMFRALDLERAILNSLMIEIKKIELDKLSIDHSEMNAEHAEIKKGLVKVNGDIDKLVESSVNLLEKNTNGMLTDEMFVLMNKKIQEQIREKNAEKNLIEDKLSQFESRSENDNSVREAAIRFIELDFTKMENRSLGRMLIRELIRSIVVESDNSITIEYVFANPANVV